MGNNIYISESKINGRGIFGNKVFKNKEKIIDFYGPIVSTQKLLELELKSNETAENWLQIGSELYMGPYGENGDFLRFINHSCDPNAGIIIDNKNVFLVLIKSIECGEEITFDYSTTMKCDSWEIPDCHCGAENCRGRIRDFKYLSIDVRQRYINLGIVPEYNSP